MSAQSRLAGDRLLQSASILVLLLSLTAAGAAQAQTVELAHSVRDTLHLLEPECTRRGVVSTLEAADPVAATLALEHDGEIEECGHFGRVLRVATRGVDPEAAVRRVLAAAAVEIKALTPGRATVEDAFVSMVREDRT